MNKTLTITETLDEIPAFIDSEDERLLILTGAAGSGKTTLITRLALNLQRTGTLYHLTATTGRAAHVLEEKVNRFFRESGVQPPQTNQIDEGVWYGLKRPGTSRVTSLGYEAPLVRVTTLHSLLYEYSDISDDPDKLIEDLPLSSDNSFQLIFNPVNRQEKGVIIVDEASMIPDSFTGESFARFGTGRLLNDLFRAFPNKKFIFSGDPAQLPPVKASLPPALSPGYLTEHYGIEPRVINLAQVFRQAAGSDILKAASMLRQQALDKNNPNPNTVRFAVKGLPAIRILANSSVLAESYLQQIVHHYRNQQLEGLYQVMKKQMLISYTNREAFSVNRRVRQALFGQNPQMLNKGDILQVTQNSLLFGLNNGDFIQVLEIGHSEQAGLLNFIRLKVKLLTDGTLRDILLITDTLASGQTNIPHTAYKGLLRDFTRRMAKKGFTWKKHKRIMMQLMSDDPYLNAIRAVYGYAVTCHKAQGGEWPHVFITLGNRPPGYDRPYNWFYTAITRAREKVSLTHQWYLSEFN